MKLDVNFYFTLMKTLNFISSKKLSRGHVVDIYIALLEKSNFENCNFRLLKGILEGLFLT